MRRTRHAIIFVTPFDADTSAVNLATGRHGFGHIALWGGQTDGDRPIVLDSSIGQGVGFRPLHAMTRGVPYVPLYLEDDMGAWIFRRAMRCIGSPYDYGGLWRGRVRGDAFTCSGLVACALPVQIQAQCRPQTRPVSPNDIARGLGVPKWSPSP